MREERHYNIRHNAWLLDFGHEIRAAVGAKVLLHIIDDPKLHTVPCTPSFCRNVLYWQTRLLPVMDIASLLDGKPQTPLLVAIAGYHNQVDNVTRFCALTLSASPIAITVGDAQSCELPEQPVSWNKFALSCFNYNDVPIPILNLARIFSK